MIALAPIDQLRSSVKYILEVLGTPAPKGSSRPMLNRKTGIPFTFEGGSKTTEIKIRSWSTAVREAALHALAGRTTPPFVDVAIAVTIVFHVARPKGHWGSGKNAGTIRANAPTRPATKPDIDKLARTTLDALTGAIFDDDSRISDLVLSKRWATAGREGATITITEAA